MLARYMTFTNNINEPSEEGVVGTGNMQVLVYGSEGDEPVFNVWALDAGRHAPDTIGGQAVGDDGLPGWDWIRHSQVHWYFRKSEELEARYGRKVPSLMFFHIPHDHVNDYVGNYFGIRLGFSANAGFGAYGLEGSEKDRLRGARVFVLDESDPSRFETNLIYARDYGIGDLSIPSDRSP